MSQKISTRSDEARLSLSPKRGRAARRAVAGLAVAIALAACGGGGDDAGGGSLAIPVDATVVPAQATLGDRPVARMVGASGVAMDFIANELMVSTDDRAKLDAMLARWGGTVVTEGPAVNGRPRTYQIKLDPSPAVVSDILGRLNGAVKDLHGTFRVSSDAGAKLLAIALSEANAGGMTVTPNFVISKQAIASGTSMEAAAGDNGFPRNAFDWPYMNRGSAQDIGVAAAWQVMQRAGAFDNKVRIMVLDGGFVQDPDFPDTRSVIGDWNAPNLVKCGDGSDCPWHGTHVTQVLMGKPDNNFGVAGPAGPVGELIAMPLESDFAALVFTLERLVTATFGANPKIINYSAGFELDLGWDIAVKAACLGLCPSISESIGGITMLVQATNKLIFASAGNAGKDVDNTGDLIEGSTFIPCELGGVICVGGMGHDTTAVDPGSNYSTKEEDSSVDIYGPYKAWVGSDPDDTRNFAHLHSGTSFSSPFVAGVAAMVWASKPELSADEVWNVLKTTAHVGGVRPGGGNQRRVDAFAAVASVLAGDPPVITFNASETAPLNREWAVTAAVADDGTPCPPTVCPLTWSPTPARVTGNTAFYRFTTAGAQTVSVTAVDAVGQAAIAQKTVTVENSPPVVTIAAPTAAAIVSQGVSVQFLASATDVNEGPDPGPGPLGCVWTSSVATDALPLGCSFDFAFATQGARTLTVKATDPQGLTASQSLSLTVGPPPVNLPPTITTVKADTGAPAYEDGYTSDASFALSAAATDPEGDNPITFVWNATSLVPNSATTYATKPIGTGATFTWVPSSTAGLLGGFAELGNACYNGQKVRISVTATDSLGHSSTRTHADIKIYECTLN